MINILFGGLVDSCKNADKKSLFCLDDLFLYFIVLYKYQNYLTKELPTKSVECDSEFFIIYPQEIKGVGQSGGVVMENIQDVMSPSMFNIDVNVCEQSSGIYLTEELARVKTQVARSLVMVV